MNSTELLRIAELYSRKNEVAYGAIKVIRVPDQKTVFVEQIDGAGWAIMMEQVPGRWSNILGRVQFAQ
jgi:hypothetical protein